MTSMSLWRCLLTCSMVRLSPLDDEGHTREVGLFAVAHGEADDVEPATPEHAGHPVENTGLVSHEGGDGMVLDGGCHSWSSCHLPRREVGLFDEVLDGASRLDHGIDALLFLDDEVDDYGSVVGHGLFRWPPAPAPCR